MVIDTIRKFDPHRLSDAPRTPEGKSVPIEDLYQQEFYRCLLPLLLDNQIAMSPEYLIRTGDRSGRIDFRVEQKKWGLELLRKGDRIKQHMKRFEEDGQYFPLILEELMQDYLVLDFNRTAPRKRYPEYRGHLYHIVFSKDFKNVRVIDALDLSEVEAFVLAENASFFH